MRFRVPALATAAALFFSAGSGAQPPSVRTMAAPRTAITQFHSFYLLPTPRRHDGVRTGGAFDPMEKGSPANRALRKAVSHELMDRGYFESEWMPDFVVAVYASTDALDLSDWEYGYWYAPRWWSEGTLGAAAASFEPGTVVVDVVNSETLDVLWRGTATVRMGADEIANTNQLLKAAIAIVDNFPRAHPIVVASRAGAPR